VIRLAQAEERRWKLKRRTGMQLSVLGFGCGAVGGLMVHGDPPRGRSPPDVNYFDTAVQYGGGESEKNLETVR
jgi:L-galactose dehydrogenase/L-glyceraldehyde 3-phosphate reductase